MWTVAQNPQYLLDLIQIVMEIKPAIQDRHVAGIGPVGDIDLVILQKGLHGSAQEGRIVTRHRGHDQHDRFLACTPRAAHVGGVASKVGQLDPGAGPHLGRLHTDGLALNLDALDAPGRAWIAAGQVGKEVSRGKHPPTKGGVPGEIQR